MINIVLFGKPGAGKGTQADFLKGKYNLRTLAQEMFSVIILKTKQNWASRQRRLWMPAILCLILLP
jgi:adenylate kinase family enzyme